MADMAPLLKARQPASHEFTDLAENLPTRRCNLLAGETEEASLRGWRDFLL
jgi:hypothetical protein